MVRWLRRLVVAGLLVTVATCGLAWWLLRGSLPALDGELALPGLSAPVDVQRDALGVVTIDAQDEADAMRALGYVHAQERYFEMDLLRRTSAGELSALFGAVALDVDRRHRVHRMRARVDAHLASIAGERMPLLEAYTDGVNAGLAALRLELSLARMAAERRDHAGYAAALARVRALVPRLWPRSTARDARLRELDAIAALPLAVELPTLGTTLDQLRLQRGRRDDARAPM